MNDSALAVAFRWQISKNWQFCMKLLVFWKLSVKYNSLCENVHRIFIAIYFCITFHFLFIHSCFQNSSPFKNKLLVFGENDSHHLSYFLQTHIFWNFDHISTIYNQINYRNIWFPEVMIILIMMAQFLFSMFFPKKTCTLMPLKKLSLKTINCVCFRSWLTMKMY